MIEKGSTLLATGCAAIAFAVASALATPLTAERRAIAPLVDAHQHMMSPAAMALVEPRRSLPVVSVPPALDKLLKAREQVLKPVPLEEVFTSDAIILEVEEVRWWKGPDQLRKAVESLPPLRFVPKAFEVDGSAGSISGNGFIGAGKDETFNFQFALRRDHTGRWRIASEMMMLIKPPTYAPAITAERIIEVLDDAGIKYGVVLSLGYWFGQPQREIEDRRHKTQAENDWTIAEAAKYPDRLIAFCGVNPLADYAVEELERCAKMPAVRGMKIHIRNSRVDLANSEHVEKLKRFFRAANANRLAVVAHIRGQAEALLDVFAQAPDVPIQVAHMASDWATADAFAEAIKAARPGTRNLYFDWTQALPIESEKRTPELMAKAAAIMRKIGLDRVFFGTDMPLASNASPRDWWRKTVLTLPLSDDEIRNIADNVPPYMRSIAGD